MSVLPIQLYNLTVFHGNWSVSCLSILQRVMTESKEFHCVVFQGSYVWITVLKILAQITVTGWHRRWWLICIWLVYKPGHLIFILYWLLSLCSGLWPAPYLLGQTFNFFIAGYSHMVIELQWQKCHSSDTFNMNLKTVKRAVVASHQICHHIPGCGASTALDTTRN